MEDNVFMKNMNIGGSDFNDDKEIERQETPEQKPKVKKKKKHKKKASFGTILKRIFLGIIIGVVALAVIGYSVLYFAFDVELFSTASNIVKVNKTVDANSKYKNQFSSSDYESLSAKLTAESLSDPAFLISDKEIASYIDKEIEEGLNISVGSINLVKDCLLEIIQVDFFTSESASVGYLTDINIVIKLDLTKVKETKLSKFPMNLVSKYIPNTIYVSATSEILSDGDSYKLSKKDLQVNNLNSKQTSKLIGAINSFCKTGTADELCIKLCEPFVKYLIADLDNETLFDAFEKFGAKSYGFYTEDKTDYLIIYKHELSDTATIKYNDDKNVNNDNLTSYLVRDNKIVFKNLSCVGYNFLGWFDGAGDSSNKVEYIIAWDLKDRELYAKWEIIEYQITYDMRNSTTDVPNPTTYTIESEIELSTPYKQVEAEFKGWTFKYTDTRELVSGYDNPDTNGKIKKGTYGNLTIYARFDDERILELYADGKYQDDMGIVIGETFSTYDINENFNPAKVGMAGYKVKKWYTDKELTNEYDYNTLVKDDMVLYGEWEYVINLLKFYPYISEFKQGIASAQKLINIDSCNELEAYLEYIVFNNVQDKVDLKFTYTSNYNLISADINKVIENYKFNNTLNVGISISYNPNALGGVTFYIITNSSDYASLVMDSEKVQVLSQQNNALSTKFIKTREDDFDDFKINNVSKSIDVWTSWQLAYCLEQGYKPNCRTGSDAERIYNKAKTVLRNICDDSMTDVQKLRAMYEWLTLNVSYDQKAFNASSIMSASDCKKYNSWFAEGVFDSGVAVCEGYAKAFIIMSRIEGIPMIFVTGNAHAWNKVMIDGNWYGIDATHGDLNVSDMEVNSYKSFLFTDEYKESQGYKTSDYNNIYAEEVYDYFDEMTYEYNTQEFDLYVENIDEMNIIANYIKDAVELNGYKNYTIELEFSSSVNLSMATGILSMVLKRQFATVSYYSISGRATYIFITE